MKHTKRIVFDALLTAIALSLFLVEMQIPNPVPVPGIKIGLANVVTVVAMVLLTPADALAILAVRILLGSVFSGNMSALLYSAAGGLCCYVAMLVFLKIVTKRQIWVLSAIGGIAHNIGQMIVAVAVTRTPELFIYLPVLLIGGILAGILTGTLAQLLVFRCMPIFRKVYSPKLNNEKE